MSKKIFKNRRLFYARRIIIDYLIIIAISSLLLFSTLTTKDGNNIKYIDSLFTCVSALTDTSLRTLEIVDTFNLSGQIIILILIQIGGFGIMALKILILMILQRKVSIANRMMVQAEYNLSFKSGIVKRIKISFSVIIILEIIFAIIFSIYMYLKYNYDIDQSIWFGLFQSVSSINNSGFTLTTDSLIQFQRDYFFQICTMLLVIVGGLGFPFIYEIVEFIKSKRNKKSFRFSLFAKVNVSTYFLIVLIGFLTIFIFEYNNNILANLNPSNIFRVLFHVVSSRSGGFYTNNLTEFNQSSTLVFMILMFIGTAPASCGGGIRTTTFAIVVLYLYNFMRSKDNIEVFNRRIANIVALKSFNIFAVSIFLIMSASFILTISDPDMGYLAILFDSVSAFGTSGLSSGITDDLSTVGKFVLIVLMIIGHLGITNTLLLFGSDTNKQQDIKSVEENLILG